MKLRSFLKNEARIGDIVVIREHGWQTAMTRIDNHGLYEHSIPSSFLDWYDVVQFGYEEREWATVDILAVDIKMDREAIHNVKR
jgi:hypothetical protein